MERWAGRVAVVTGASFGIGSSVAKALVCLGMKVVGCGRNIDRIKSLAEELQGQKGSFFPMRCDVSKEEDVVDMFHHIRKHEELGTVHVIVNNAGLAHEAPLLSGQTSQWRDMVEVNVLGLLTCTREAFTIMEEQGIDDGHIFLISSMSGHRSYRKKESHFYQATKRMVTSMTEGIRSELREKKTHTRVTAISPGLVETNFFASMCKDTDKAQKFIESNPKMLEGKDIADAVVYALTAPPHVQVHDILLRSTEQEH